MWAASMLCFFGFFRMGELTIPNDKAYDYSIHLSPGDIATDSHTNPTMLQVHLKTSKTDTHRKGPTVTVDRTRDQLYQCSSSLPCHKRDHTRTMEYPLQRHALSLSSDSLYHKLASMPPNTPVIVTELAWLPQPQARLDMTTGRS